MAAIIVASAPRPTRIVTPSTSISIIPTSDLDLHRGGLGSLPRTGVCATAPTTAGTNCKSSDRERSAAASLSWRRQPNNCCGDNPWRRATAQTESPPATISATIRALSSSLHFRRKRRSAWLFAAYTFWMTMLNCSAPDAPPTLAVDRDWNGRARSPRQRQTKSETENALAQSHQDRLARQSSRQRQRSAPGNTVFWRGLSRLTDIAVGATVSRRRN